MSATNETTYLKLPQFIGTDIPSWLGDWNSAMALIDSGVESVKTTSDSALSKANQALTQTGVTDTNVQSLQNQINVLKAAVENYDNILKFKSVTIVKTPNNLRKGGFILIQNLNKTINKLCCYYYFPEAISQPTTYNYDNNGTTQTWLDLATVEDNCFNMLQSTLPSRSLCLTLGYSEFIRVAGNPYPLTIQSWFDGVTTHIGFNTSDSLSVFLNGHGSLNTPIFITGSVINDGDNT